MLQTFIDNVPINASTLSRDLGILVSSDLSFHQHIVSICQKASNCANMILRAFSSRDVRLLYHAFTIYVRPTLEYCTEIWNPCDVFHVNLIEKVQRNYTKRIFARAGNSTISYHERLRSLGARTREFRRGVTDLTMVFQLINGLISLSSTEFFSPLPSRNRTRGHNRRLAWNRADGKRSLSNFFTSRITPIWNKLPQEVVNAVSLNAFKHMLQKLPQNSVVPKSRIR